MKYCIYILGLMSILLAACGSENDAPKPPPKSVQELVSGIRSVSSVVQDGRTVMRIEFNAEDDGFSSEHMLSGRVIDAATILKGMRQYHLPDQKADIVDLVIRAKLVDQYGKESEGQIFDLPFVMSEIAKVEFDNITYDNLLRFTEPSTIHTRAGAEVLQSWCKDEDHLKASGYFCANNDAI